MSASSTTVRVFAVSALLAFAPVTIRADVIYDGFQQTAGLTINGNAATTVTSDGTVLRLTRPLAFDTGSAFSTAQVSTLVFTSVFSFRITEAGGTTAGGNPGGGADGLVFVIQNVANNIGISGGGMGFQGISPGIGVEFDTFMNAQFNDPSASHVGIDINGSVLHDANNGPTANVVFPELDDGDRWWSWVLYDGITLNAYLLRSESTTEPPIPSTALLSYNVNLSTLLGATTAFAGFTSATGAAWENHDIIYWRYTEAVPEPASMLLVGAGGLICVTRRRQTRRAY